MSGINYLAVFVTALAAFLASSMYYIIFGKALAAAMPPDAASTDARKAPAWKKAAEFLRGLVVTFVVAFFVTKFGVAEWKGVLQFALLVWLGFPFMILTGSVLWDNRPWKFAAIHSGDWLMKLLLMFAILGMWHK